MTRAHNEGGPDDGEAPRRRDRDRLGPGVTPLARVHAFVRVFLFKVGIVHRERFTEQMRAAYLAPHPTWSPCTAILVFPREIPVWSCGSRERLPGNSARGVGGSEGQAGIHRLGDEGSGIHT